MEKVGIRDSFLELGGHSLKATHLANRIELAIGVRIAIKDILTNATPEKLVKLLECSAGEEYEPIPKAEVKEYYPMSEVQKRLFILAQMDEMSVSYNVPYCFRLCNGMPDEERLNGALQKLAERHESLRTGLCVVDGEFRQIVYPHVDFKLTVKNLEKGEIKNEIENFIKPFDLELPPLFRAELVKNTASEGWLLLDFHHSIVDGYSIKQLLKELGDLYDGKYISEPTLQYKDYSEWLTKRDISSQRSFWKKTFETMLEDKELPTDIRRSESTERNASVVRRKIDWLDSKQIDRICSDHGITAHMFFISILSMLLARYYDCEDVVVGIPASCRVHPDTEKIVGMLVNTLPIRLKPVRNMRFSEYIENTRSVLANALTNQEYPFNAIVEDSRVKRSKGKNPLFDVFFNYFDQNFSENITTSDFTAEPYEIDYVVDKFDLVFDVIVKDGVYSLDITYKTGLYFEKTVQQMSEHYVNLIRWALKHEFDTIVHAEMLSETEKFHQGTKKNFDTTLTFPDMLRAKVEVCGEKTALVCREQSMSYQQLLKESSAVAAAICEFEFGAENIVGVMAKPGFGMFVGAIAVMFSGNAYMPIDPDYPDERIRYMLRQSGCKLVLVEEGAKDFHLDSDIHTMYIEEAVQHVQCNLPEIKPEQLAYVIFTSGSSGQPKGVMIEHRSLANMIQWNNDYYHLTDKDKTTKYAGFGFDASVHEMYPPLVAGAEIHIIPEELRLDIRGICSYIDNHHINIGFFPTPICELVSKEKCKALKMIITGGDRLKSYSEDYTIYNNYGPTECTVLTTVFAVDKAWDSIPIGKPIANTEIYIVNDFGQLQPAGLPGEIWIGGAGLARGYINDEKRTAERFIPNPFRKGERLYRTGDIGRWLPDGNIEYLGRNDNQVKVRGNRIELGEVESVCTSRCGLTQCVAVVDNSTGSDRIVMFYMADEDVNPTEVRKTLSDCLPYYMIPDVWIRRDSFPYSPNGKLDRNKLEVEATEVTLEKTSVSDSVTQKRQLTQYERVVEDVWRNVLGLDNIGLNDNFFEVGGTSLTLVSVLTGLGQDFPGVLKIADLFANPTIEQLAGYIERSTTKTNRHILRAVKLAKNCFGGTREAQYHSIITGNIPENFTNKFRTAVLFAVSRFAGNKFTCVEEKIAEDRYRTVECDLTEVMTLEEAERKTIFSEEDWRLEHAIKNPSEGMCTIGIHVGDVSEISQAEQHQIAKIFDIWLQADIRQDGIHIWLKKNRKELNGTKTQQLMRLIAGVVNAVAGNK